VPTTKKRRERSDRKGGDKFAGETKRKASGAATGGQWASREESAAAELRGGPVGVRCLDRQQPLMNNE